MTHTYTIGALYHPDRKSWPERGVYQYRGGEHELVLFLDRPTAREVRDVRNGTALFGLLVEGDVIMFLYRLGAMPWSDCPFSWHLVPEDERVLPPALPESEEGRALLHVVLVDGATGIIRALRTVTLPPSFTAALHLAIRAQAQQPFDRAAYDHQIADLYRRHLTSEAMAQAATTRGVGGR